MKQQLITKKQEVIPQFETTIRSILVDRTRALGLFGYVCNHCGRGDENLWILLCCTCLGIGLFIGWILP